MRSVLSKLKKKPLKLGATVDELQQISKMQGELKFHNDQSGSSREGNPTEQLQNNNQGIQVEIDGMLYSNMQRLDGAFLTKKDSKINCVGVNEVGTNLVAAVSPTIIEQGKNSNKIVQEEKHNKKQYTKSELTKRRDELSFEGLGGKYRDTYIKELEKVYGTDKHFSGVNVLVLGTRTNDGYHDNAGGYTLGRNEENKVVEIAQFKKMTSNIDKVVINPNDKNAGGWTNKKPVTVFHSNVTATNNQNLDSDDFEGLLDIYNQTVGQGEVLVVHCTDAMDRAGAYLLAMDLLSDYENVFDPKNPGATVDKIEMKQKQMQAIRGGNFCTRHEGRLEFAGNMASLMKSIQLSRDAMSEVNDADPNLYNALMDNKSYLGQLYYLRDAKKLPPQAKELKAALEVRAEFEHRYFQMVKYRDTPSLSKELLNFEQALNETKNPDKNIVKQWKIIQRDVRIGVEPEELLERMKGINNQLKEFHEQQQGVRISPKLRRRSMQKFMQAGAYTAEDLFDKIGDYKGPHAEEMGQLYKEIYSRSVIETEKPMTSQEIFSEVLKVVAKETRHIQPNSKLGKFLKNFHDHNPEAFENALNDTNTKVDGKPLNQVLRDNPAFGGLNKGLGNKAEKGEVVWEKGSGKRG